MNSRRQFLINCSTVTLMAGVLPGTLLSAVAKSASAPTEGFESFSTRVGTTFDVLKGDSGAVTLKLVAATPLESRHPDAHLAPDAKNEKFSLLFRGSGRGDLTQNTYIFDHPELGRQQIFIVPVPVAGSDQPHYEAVFNRPCPKA